MDKPNPAAPPPDKKGGGGGGAGSKSNALRNSKAKIVRIDTSAEHLDDLMQRSLSAIYNDISRVQIACCNYAC